MNRPSHDYSRHTIDELQVEIYNLDVTKFPERARSLQVELLNRLLVSDAAASEVSSANAIAEGAGFSQLTAPVARRFFWPFFGFNFLVTFVYGFLVAFLASIIGAIVIYVRTRGGGQASDPTQFIQLGMFLVLAVPFAAFWLRQVTKRSFGGYGLRVLKTGAKDVA